MAVTYILLKDTPGSENDTPTALHNFTPFSFVIVKRGELITRCKLFKNYKYQLLDSKGYFNCRDEDIALLSPEEFLLMKGMDNLADRMSAFSHDKLCMGVTLLPGSGVYVDVDDDETLRKKAVVHFKGEVRGHTGTQFGMELLDKEAKLGNTDGTFDGQHYFECEDGYGLFLPLSKLSQHVTAVGSFRNASEREEGKTLEGRQYIGKRYTSCEDRSDSSEERRRSYTVSSVYHKSSSAVTGSNSGDEVPRHLSIGSRVQIASTVPSGVLYGTIKSIGHLPNVTDPMAGIEMEEAQEGYTDGSWTILTTRKVFQQFNCAKCKGLYYPLHKLHPDERYTPHEKTSGEMQIPRTSLLKARKPTFTFRSFKTSKDDELSHLLSERDREIEIMTGKIKELKKELDAIKEIHIRSPIAQPEDHVVSWKIDRSEIDKISKKQIGIGAWGVVYSGHFRGEPVAIKTVHHEVFFNVQGTVDMIKREISIMAHIQHPNLVRFIGAVLDEQVDNMTHTPFIVLELLDMNLRTAYKTRELERSTLLSIFCDVAYALHYLHEQSEAIIHRDVSAPNVLLKRLSKDSYRAKVSDFGSANLLKQSKTAGAGAILYTAPEMFPTEDNAAPLHTTKIDVYSYGILLLEVISRDLPTMEKRHSMLQSLSIKWDSIHELVMHCIKRSPSDRLTMRQVLNKLHSFHF